MFLATLAQAAIIFVVSDRSPLPHRQVDPGTSVYQTDPRDMPPAWAELLSVKDPGLFAQPSSRGFAGRGWDRAARFDPPASEWSEPARWLTNSPVVVARNLEARLASVTLAAPRAIFPPPRFSEVQPPAVSFPTQSWVRVEGDLARRGLRADLTAPSIVHSNLITNSIVQLCVRPDGEPLSAVLLGSSGLKSADQRALELATSARFGADPAADAPNALAGTWGNLVFHWLVVPPPSGNGGKP